MKNCVCFGNAGALGFVVLQTEGQNWMIAIHWCVIGVEKELKPLGAPKRSEKLGVRKRGPRGYSVLWGVDLMKNGCVFVFFW